MKWSEIKKDRDLLQIYLLMFGLIMLVAGFALIKLYFNLVVGIQSKYIVSAFWVVAVIPVIFYFLYLKQLGMMSYSEIGLKKEGTGKSVFLGLIVGIVLGFLGWFFLWFFNSPVEKLPTVYIYWFIFSSVFSAPIREEVLTRGLLWSVFKRTFDGLSRFGKMKLDDKGREILLVVIISLTFWIIHLGRPLEIMFTTLLIDSFAYSLIYLKTKNLFAPITAHAISNLFIILRTIVF